MTNFDLEVMSAIQALFQQWLRHAKAPTKNKAAEKLALGWRQTAVFQVVDGVPSLELRVQEPKGLRYICVRSVKR